MLLDNFYQIQEIAEREAHSWLFTIEFNPNHAIYQGHFPGHPVVPGVCTLQTIKECAELILKSDLTFSQIQSCKFLSAINPSERSLLELTITLKDDDTEQFRIQAEGNWKGKEAIKLKALLANK